MLRGFFTDVYKLRTPLCEIQEVFVDEVVIDNGIGGPYEFKTPQGYEFEITRPGSDKINLTHKIMIIRIIVALFKY